mmetsp:Transcript_2209/g.6571  ORF Transcript_2209/g.6571 Transcript_2209/m.6571 type:complete len:146 (-) Transcript_2209:172-609(-)
MHPILRSTRRWMSSGSKSQDRVFVKGLRLFGRHGVFEEEQRLGQKFEVDVSVGTDLSRVAATDNVQHGLDYSLLVKLVKEIVSGPPKQTVEAVAGEIAEKIFERFNIASNVVVKVSKPCVALEEQISEIGVELWRSRQHSSSQRS